VEIKRRPTTVTSCKTVSDSKQRVEGTVTMATIQVVPVQFAMESAMRHANDISHRIEYILRHGAVETPVKLMVMPNHGFDSLW
jgi:hypothetical protein